MKLHDHIPHHVHGARQARIPRRGWRALGRRALLRIALWSLAATLLAAGGVLGYGRWATPRVDRLDPIVAEPGGLVRVEGRNFGAVRGDSRVEVDGVAPTASSYVAWGPNSIALRLPSSADSGLIYVVTRRGRSNPKLFMNRSRLPVAARGESSGRSGPYLASISAEKGPIGSLLVLSGYNFGSNREGGQVLFSWNPEMSSARLGDRSEPSFVAASEGDGAYELWSDKEIRVRVPDGAASGTVAVNGAGGRSNGLFFGVVDQPGQKRYSDRRSYSIQYSSSITKTKASGANELYLWMPKPVESAAQRIAKVLTQEPAPLVPDYRGAALYRFKDIATGQDLAVSQSFLVQSWAVETTVDPDKIQKPAEPPPFLQPFLAADELVPAAAPEIQALARRITQGERNPWRASRLVFEHLTRNLAWTDARSAAKPLEALAAKTADSASYAVLAAALLRSSGVPAIPVAGYLIDPSRQAARHAWVEFYVYGLGWVPMDPILGSGARPGGFDAAFEDRGRYFGAIDNRRIAFSRGFTALSPMTPSGRRASPARPVAFQSFYEEAIGALEAYSSFWSEVEVTGLY